ncbi:MAG: DUF599 domain-containing protein [Geminicoccales bacterium]
MQLSEILIVLAAVACLVGYQIKYVYDSHRRPETTPFGLGATSRRLWVESVMAERRDVLAVQTLRNWTMAASFLASTAFLISVGLLSFLLTAGDVPEFVHHLNLIGTTSEQIVVAKVLILLINFFIAFFNCTQAIRYYNHVALEINVPRTDAAAISPAVVAKLLNRGALFFTLGMRGFYISVPLVLWIFGPLWFLGGAIALVVVLHRLDHVD